MMLSQKSFHSTIISLKIRILNKIETKIKKVNFVKIVKVLQQDV